MSYLTMRRASLIAVLISSLGLGSGYTLAPPISVEHIEPPVASKDEILVMIEEAVKEALKKEKEKDKKSLVVDPALFSCPPS